jgi:OOP family OmpA-OmpF porin
MKKLKPLLLALLAGFLTTSLYAQTEPADPDTKYDPKYYKKKDQDKLESFKKGDALFPPKPKSDISIGVKAGLAFIRGDVADYPIAPPGAIGISFRKAMGHVFSLRMEGNYTRNFGLDFRPRTGYTFGPPNNAGATNVNPWLAEDYSQPVYMNYRTKTFDLTLQGVFNLNNINFYRENNKWNLYAAVGLGLVGINTKVDVLDANMNPYDFSNINFNNSTGGRGDFRTEKQRVLGELDNLYGGFPGELDFESDAEFYSGDQGFNLGDDYYRLRALFTGAIGLRYRLNRRIEIEGEYRLGVTFNDMLDGLRWTEQGDISPNWDNMNQLTLGLHFHLGGGREGGIWFSNPLSEAYSAAAEARKLVDLFNSDDDGDNVPNFLDKEPDTPEDMPVDVNGVTMDSDGDGVSDRDDVEFTERGALVDENGKAVDEDKDGVPDYRDKELGTAAGAQVDANGVTIASFDEEKVREIVRDEMGPVAGGCVLPIVYYDINDAKIKPTQYPQLYEIAQIMRGNPDIRIKAIGHTDVRASDPYNEELSERRVNNAVDFLVNTYGIDRSRFDVEFKGERENIIPELPDRRANREIERLHQLNRRVEFECITK